MDEAAQCSAGGRRSGDRGNHRAREGEAVEGTLLAVGSSLCFLFLSASDAIGKVVHLDAKFVLPIGGALAHMTLMYKNDSY